MALRPRPTVDVSVVDEIKTSKYVVHVEFYGVDDGFDEDTVRMFSEWNLFQEGAIVTSLKVEKIPGTGGVLRAYEWSVAPEDTEAFAKDPVGTLGAALSAAGITTTPPRFLEGPDEEGADPKQRTDQLRAEPGGGYGGAGKCFEGDEYRNDCAAPPRRSSGWSCG